MIDPNVQEAVAFWSQVSTVFLCLLSAVFVAVPLILLFFAQKYMRLGRKKLVLPMLYAQLWAVRVENATLTAAHRVIGVPIAANTGAARVQATVEGWVKRLRQV